MYECSHLPAFLLAFERLNSEAATVTTFVKSIRVYVAFTPNSLQRDIMPMLIIPIVSITICALLVVGSGGR